MAGASVTVVLTDDDSTLEALRDIYDANDGDNWTNTPTG